MSTEKATGPCNEEIVKSGPALEYVNCPICGASEYRIWMLGNKGARYVRCKTCKTVYASPRLSHQERYAWLDGAFGLNEKAFQNAKNRKSALVEEAMLISKHVRCGRILDVGCNFGDLFEYFPEPLWKKYGVELVAPAAEHAARAFNAKVYAGTMKQACLPDSHFDLITMLDMFYYMDEPRSELEETSRILKPGGILAIEIPGQKYQLLRSRGPVCWLLDRRWTRFYADSSYLFWVSPSGLAGLLRECGFDVIESAAIGSPLSSNKAHNLLNSVYIALMKGACGLSESLLTWAPKYLCVARKVG